MGRRKKEDIKIKQYRLRMSVNEMDELDYLCSISGKSKAEYIRDTLRMYGNLVRYQH